MSAAIAHRGPDAEGIHMDACSHLAARRLSIIDLESGAQPIYTPDKKACIVFNGEIYNYRALRKELEDQGCAFKTKTDTEVVLAAFRTWGKNCLARLKGMFAFCIRDLKKNRLFLARDRFGIKPLYLCTLPDSTILFASEIKALLQHPRVQRALHPQAVDTMLTYGFNLAPHTFFENIQQVLPGHWLLVSDRGIERKQYWDIDLTAGPLAADADDIAAELASRFEQSVRQSIVADVPVAAYLSGGIDSSAVTGMYARNADASVKTITITFDQAGYDESRFSRSVARYFGTDNEEFCCSVSQDDIQRLVYFLENPLVTLLNLPLFLLSKKTRERGIKVVLTGDGADEVLGGYDYFKLLKAMAFIGKNETPFRKNLLRGIYPHLQDSEDAAAQYVYLTNIRNRFPVLHPALPYQFQAFQMKDQLYSADFKAVLDKAPPANPFFFDPRACAHRPLIDQALYFETRMRLLNLTLPLSDKMSMANSVEARPLFLDHELVDFFFRIPHHLKIQGLSEKHILKRSMHSLLPREICTRKKQPLQPPGKWFVDAAGDLLRELLSNRSIRQTGCFNPGFVDFILSEHETNPKVDYSGVITVVFFVQLWHALFLRGTS